MRLRTIEILESLSAGMRARIRGDRAAGLEPHEETLTQNLVSALRRQLAGTGARVYVREIPRHEEALLYGADLAVWFQDAGGLLAGIHLQAKRQYADDTYRRLDHANAHGAQHDRLLSGARAAGARAGYAFYNGLHDWEPARAMCSARETGADSHGVNIAQARFITPHVARSVPRRDVDRYCAPLRCLLGCQPDTAAWQDADLASALLRWQGGDDSAGLVEPGQAPSYLLPLLTAARSSTPEPVDLDPANDGDNRPDPFADELAGHDSARSDDGGPTVTAMLVARGAATRAEPLA